MMVRATLVIAMMWLSAAGLAAADDGAAVGGPVAAPETASSSAAAGELRDSISQYGVTWTFAEPARVGHYVTGDWWVVGPVTVKAISPAPAKGRNGSVVNPPAGARQGYDDRLPKYEESLAAALPLELKAGQSLVTTWSVDKVGEKTPDTLDMQYCRGPIRAAVVLTCVAEAPAADAFRPAYVGDWKETFRASQIRKDLMPNVKYEGQLPNVAMLERYTQRIWLDHYPGWQSRSMHPYENMPDYGREITRITGEASLVLTTADPDGKLDRLMKQMVQLGIDYYGVTKSDPQLWNADGGHNSGRKLPILLAGRLLNNEGMLHVDALFAEDAQTYYGEGWHGQKALWRIAGKDREHEHLPPQRWAGPPFKGDNDGWKSEAYRSLNGPTWVPEALAARLFGLKAAWNHDAFFDYVDRWVVERGDGMVNRKSMERISYEPYGGKFSEAIWIAYREKADAIGAAIEERSKKNSAE